MDILSQKLMLTIPQVCSLVENAELEEGCNLTGVFVGRLDFKFQPLSDLYMTIFDRKATPFVYLWLKIGTTFSF